MKQLIGTLAAASMLLVSAQALATQKTPADCPPLASVKSHSNFTWTEKVLEDFWAFLDRDSYEFSNKNWITLFIASLPGVQSQQDALTAGKEMFDNKVVFTDAEILYNICVYGKSDMEYTVVSMDMDQQPTVSKYIHLLK